MASRNRGFLSIQPLGTSRRLALHSGKHGLGNRVAEMEGATQGPSSDIHGWLTILPNGTYVIEQVRGGIRSVNQRKAASAVASMESRNGKTDG